MEASPQRSTINRACRAGASIAVGMRLVQSLHHNALPLANDVEHQQYILMLMDFIDALLLQISVNGN